MEDLPMPNIAGAAAALATSTSTSKEFTIPVDLLRNFKSDIRTIPHVLPTNGWIVFDRNMLISILRGNDVNARAELAKEIEKYAEGGGELVMMAR